MKIREIKRNRQPKAKEVIAEHQPLVELFDPRRLPKEELDWIKATHDPILSLQRARLVATSWIDWLEPGYAETLQGQAELQASPKFYADQMTSTVPPQPHLVWIGIKGLASLAGVFSELSKIRPEYPDLEPVFAPGNEFKQSVELGYVRSLLQVWPEKKQKILDWAFDHERLKYQLFLDYLKEHAPLSGFIEGAADLVLLFPESRDEVREFLASKATEVEKIFHNLQSRAHAPRARAPFDPFVNYQKFLRAMTILTAQEGRIDEQGRIKLTFAEKGKLKKGSDLPERPQI